MIWISVSLALSLAGAGVGGAGVATAAIVAAFSGGCAPTRSLILGVMSGDAGFCTRFPGS